MKKYKKNSKLVFQTLLMSMFPFLKNSKGSNPLNTCSFLLKEFHVKHTKSKLDQILQDHIEYPSILSVKDGLFEYGIQSAAIRKGEKKIMAHLPLNIR